MIGIEINIPDEIAQQLRRGWGDLPRRALEALAAEGYRSGVLTTMQIQQMLNLQSRWETDAFLKAHNCYMDYSEEDLAQDIAAIRRVTGP
jgi:hypothetical protein